MVIHPDVKEVIVREYLKGATMKGLVKRSKLLPKDVRTILKDAGVEIRQRTKATMDFERCYRQDLEQAKALQQQAGPSVPAEAPPPTIEPPTPPEEDKPKRKIIKF